MIKCELLRHNATDFSYAINTAPRYRTKGDIRIMKLIRSKINTESELGLSLPADTLLFDIETTGLSADTSYLYLIGAICLEEGEPTLLQWF